MDHGATVRPSYGGRLLTASLEIFRQFCKTALKAQNWFEEFSRPQASVIFFRRQNVAACITYKQPEISAELLAAAVHSEST